MSHLDSRTGAPAVDRNETQGTPILVHTRGCARAVHSQVYALGPHIPSARDRQSQPDREQQGLGRATLNPGPALGTSAFALQDTPPLPGTAQWAPTALEESPKSICRFPIALIMAMMDWMVLL